MTETAELTERARHLVDTVQYLTLATVSEQGAPWNSPVFGAYDKQYNFYWGSYLNSRHSKNVLANGRAAIVIYDSTVPAGDGFGIYVEAKVEQVFDDANKKNILTMLQERHKPVPYWQYPDLSPTGPIGIFMARPIKMWVNDEGESNGSYIDTRTELSLGELRSAGSTPTH